MNSHVKGFYRRVTYVLGCSRIGSYMFHHILVLTCGHMVVRMGGEHAHWSGAYCKDCQSDVIPVDSDIPAGAD